MDTIVQEEQARKKEAQEAIEKEEALQAVLVSEEKERLNKENERISLDEEEKSVHLQVCFPDLNNHDDEETVKIGLQQRSKNHDTDHDNERKNLVPYERRDAAKKSAHVEPYVKVNSRASVEEKLEPNEKFRLIVRKKSPTGSDKERKANPAASFGSKSDCQECLDEQRKKRKVRKKNLSIEQVMPKIIKDRKVQDEE